MQRPVDDEVHRFEPLGEQNAAAINALFQEVFAVHRSLEHHRWKFLDNPDGQGIASVAIERATDRAVAVNTGRPRRFWVEGEERVFIQVCETATAPDTRSLRLYRLVTGGVAWQGHAAGIPVAYGGQTNEIAAQLGKRLFGYRQLFEIPTWERRLRVRLGLERVLGSPGRLLAAGIDRLRRLSPCPEEAAFTFERVEGFDAGFDELWLRNRDRFRVACVRDAVALNYRYRDCPVGRHRIWLARREGRLVGYVVVRLWNRAGVELATVLDLLVDLDQAGLERALYSRASRDAEAQGSDFFHVAALPGSPAAEALAGLPGCRLGSREALDRVVCCLLPLDDPEDPAHDGLRSVFDPSSWYYTQGDADFHD